LYSIGYFSICEQISSQNQIAYQGIKYTKNEVFLFPKTKEILFTSKHRDFSRHFLALDGLKTA